MHDESGEAEGRRAREEEGLPGWVCGCQTKTSGGQVENADFTVISSSKEALSRDGRISSKVACRSESKCLREEVQQQRQAYLQQSR